MVQELTKEVDELATGAETKHKMDLSVKANAMCSKSREKCKEIKKRGKEYLWSVEETEANVKVDLAYLKICLMQGQ